MNRRSTLLQIARFLLILCLATPCALHAAWPLAGQIDLSSGFGDYRSGRFHAGLDLRTGGVPGKEVKAPVAGYISRIRMAYTGYGKGLYMTGDDGHTYVFGHLQGFNPILEKLVKAKQTQTRRYFVDIELPTDSIRVKPGELIAYSGQTGAGAPHLHFEKRAPNNIPLNPLTHGYKLSDKVRPTIERIGFQMTDDHSLFSDGSRKIFFPVKGTGKAGSFKLDTVLYFNAPFGVLADCYDMMRTGGMRQTVYRMQLYVDQTLYYQVEMDTIDYNETAAASLIYDFGEAVDGEPRVKRLYHRIGNGYAGTTSYGPGKGIVGSADQLAIGSHDLRIVAEDAFGNRSELTGTFIWGPTENLHRFDSLVTINDTTIDYYFSIHAAYQQLGINSRAVFLNRGDTWHKIPHAVISEPEPNRVVVRMTGDGQPRAVFRFQYTMQTKCQIADFPFNGFALRGILPPDVAYELTDDGMIVRGKLPGRTGYHAQVELFQGDSLLGIESLQRFISMNHYAFFIPAKPEYQMVTRIQLRFQSDMGVEPRVLDSLMIVQAGRRDTVRLSVDTLFEIVIDSADLYQPCFVDLRKTVLSGKEALRLMTDHYMFGPDDLLLKGSLDLRARLLKPFPLPKQLGLCRLDKQKDAWVWLGTTINPKGELLATANRGGSYLVVADIQPPKISGISLPEYRPINDLTPEIRFTLSDDLSGFEDDRNIVITIDGTWQIPEYDPETKICRTKPLQPLKSGEHQLKIIAIDRAGNQAQKSVTFQIADNAAAKKGKGK